LFEMDHGGGAGFAETGGWRLEIGGSATPLIGMDSPRLRRRNPGRG
jgi:hypothetical protein